MSLDRMPAAEFARRIRAETTEPESRYAFFPGAGTSVSSGIPAAGDLVKEHWLPRLRDVMDPPITEIDVWAREMFPDYDPSAPAASYGDVLNRLFHTPSKRQAEMERLCEGKFPYFGYAVLASLVARTEGSFNVVLTTNFDDLMADALYLFTHARPLVIPHESLASFIRPTRMKPLVVKLHGDHRLAPQNTRVETESLKEGIESQVRSLLEDRGLVFLGYGGADLGIRRMLEGLTPRAVPTGVYWVSRSEPRCALEEWLAERNAVWVESPGFDELMLLLLNVFELDHPDPKRFEDVFRRYKDGNDALSAQVVALPTTAVGASELKQAVERADQSLPDWWAMHTAAQRFVKSDPERADGIYRSGIEKFPTNASLLGAYAVFLRIVRKDYEHAEEFFRRAIDAAPANAHVLGGYASFLHSDRRDYERADEYYRRAIEVEPTDATNLGNYAVLLYTVRKDHKRAEEFFRRAVDADAAYAFALVNYAAMLLGEGRSREGLTFLTRALDIPDLESSWLVPAVECWFCAFAHRPDADRPEALRNLKRLISDGARTPSSDLSANVARAVKEGHPDAEWLPRLAAVIVDEEDAGVLEDWSAWKAA